MSTPVRGKTPRKTPVEDVHQGNEELARKLTSPTGIAIVIFISVALIVISALVFNFLGQKATTIWAVFIVCLLFFIRHLIGNAETKIISKSD